MYPKIITFNFITSREKLYPNGPYKTILIAGMATDKLIYPSMDFVSTMK
jgi:hypothetical protein